MSFMEDTPPVERIEVTLVGGPAHGETLEVRVDRKRVLVPYAPEAEEPEIPADGSRPEPVQVAAVTLIYLRANEEATTAEYHDLELEV